MDFGVPKSDGKGHGRSSKGSGMSVVLKFLAIFAKISCVNRDLQISIEMGD